MKISFKLGLWFFICLFIIESSSMLFLHRTVVHSRILQELDSLKARGNSHREALEISSDLSTLHHISLMESHTDTEVLITNKNKEIIETSKKVDRSMIELVNKSIEKVPRQGLIIQSDWKNEKYIATVSSFVNGNTNEDAGYVYMFKKTEQVQSFISQLNRHFLLASFMIIFFMLITIYFLSKALTKPLIIMKEATERLSNGDFSVSLSVKSKDELGELSRSIQALASDLNYLKQERNEFLASISHELRTPLTYIKGYSDIGRRPTLDEKERINYLHIIHEESERVGQLLKELFKLATHDQNSFAILKEKVNLNTFLKSIYDNISPAFSEKGITLEIQCEEPLFHFIDPKRFKQVLLNLLDNALKYSNKNTTTLLKAHKKDGNIFIMISDQGIGIPNEDLPYIFERLYRVDKSRTRATGGFGMGLAIVKEIVEAHHGKISVTSTLGEGTIFTITLKEQKDENDSSRR